MDAEKPTDGRTKKAKSKKETEKFFRFPQYVNFSEDCYTPPLSEEESILREAQIAFHACRFHGAMELLVHLSESAKNRYVRLAAIYYRLYLSIYENSKDYDFVLLSFNKELSGDFPYKKEMMLLKYGFDADNTSYRSILEEFSADSAYSYHPSSYYTAFLVSLLPLENGDFSLMSHLRYDTYELLCQQMEHEGYYLEAQKLHFLLLVIYQLKNDKKKMESHIKSGLKLALEHDLYFTAAFYERWYSVYIDKVLLDFPYDFSKKYSLSENSCR